MTSCYNSCNLPCQQIYLQQTVTPTNVSAGQTTQWQFIVTNTSGNNIAGPIVISSSLAGTLLVTAGTMASGATVTVNANYTVPVGTPNNSVLTSVAFVAQGISTGTPGNYAVGTRYSKIVTTSVNVRNTIGGPTVQVSGSALFGGNLRSMSLTITNQGVVAAAYFSLNLGTWFVGCLSLPGITESSAQVFSVLNTNTLILSSGSVLNPGQTYTITMTNESCLSPCGTSTTCMSNGTCSFTYDYGNSTSPPYITNNIANIGYQRC